MNKPFALVAVLAGVVVAAIVVQAETKDVTVGYLQAAVSALTDRDEVDLTAVYPGVGVLKVCRGFYLPSNHYSRFSVKDPESKASFTSMYVSQSSSAFATLLKANGARKIRIHGYKDQGEDREDAIFVTSVEDLGPAGADQGSAAAAAGPGTAPEAAPGNTHRSFRVTIIDNSTSNRTVIINIVTNRPYTVNGTTVTVEEEP